MREIWTRFKKFTKNFPICSGMFLKQNHHPAKRSCSFSSKWRKNSGELKSFLPLNPKVPVRAVYHDLLRRVSERYNQGRNDESQGAQFHGCRITVKALKSPNNVTSTSVQYICFRKTSGSNIGAPNVLLAPGTF